MNKILGTVAIATVTSICTFAVAKNFIYSDTPFPNSNNASMVKNASYVANENNAETSGYTNLENAAEKSVKAVVHIKVNTNAQVVDQQNPFGNDDFFGQFFGGGRQYIPSQQASGSGVIISTDGYIVTNNHVIDNAKEVTVTLNDKQEKIAKVIGKDPSTDLALLKIEETNLPYLSYGNSDIVRLGEWVLAVGYPLNLETTVTAGIVSAKSRSIGVNQQKMNGSGTSAIESFIQTDAAVNPGNSGGALVNASGDLIGINSAIASPTGSYAGYSYAIPSNLVKKVIEDLMKFGNVQRGYLGIQFLDSKTATAEQKTAYGLDKIDGIYVAAVTKGGGAEAAGIKEGDFIMKVNGATVKTSPQLLEQVGRYRPGNKIEITYLRNNKEANTTIELKNINGNTSIVKNEFASKLGATFRTLTKDEAKQMNITGGVLITNIGSGKLAQQTRIKKSFVITQVDEQDIKSVEELNTKLNGSSDGKIQLSGVYPNYQGLYYYNLDLNN
jgi:serine protease Do